MNLTYKKGLSISWILALAVILACVAVPAQAQGDLAITVSSNGFFEAPTTFPSSVSCSKFSPQFVNEIQTPANQWPFTSSHPAPTITSSCIDTKTIWVENKGTVATSAPVTVTDLLTPEQPKGSTVLTTNGYCAFEALGSLSGTIWCLGDSRVFGATTNKIAANGWTCTVTQGKVSCTRSDVLLPGATYPPISIKLLREDFSPLNCFNELAFVQGGGFVDIDPSNNSQFDDFISSSLNSNGLLNTNNLVTINSVPQGRKVRVDGSVITTPHSYYWGFATQHSVEGEDNPGHDAVCQAPIPGTGTAIPGNEGYTVIGYSTGGLIASGASGAGCTQPTSFTLPNFIAGAAGNQFYEHITVRYKQP